MTKRRAWIASVTAAWGALVAAALWAGACLDNTPILGLGTDSIPDTGAVALAAIVSNPVTASSNAGAALVVELTAGTDVVYVSLPPGTIPTGGLATIRNTRTGASVSAAMAAGGFDPVQLAAGAGDILSLEVLLEGGGTQTLTLTVPASRPPIIVRTDPPPRKRDVPLNAYLLVVFSEPIDPASASGIRLLSGGAPVGGTVAVSTEGLRAVFTPAGPLTPNTDYVLSVPTGVTDLSGSPVQQAVTDTFTTGTTAAVARVVTQQSALFLVPPNNFPRTLDMEATLRSDGTFTGQFKIFYPDSGWFNVGHITCFSIVDGNKAWVAGVVDSATNPQGVGIERGWRAVDNGPAGAGVPDQLSLAHWLEPHTLGTAQEFCANTPLIDPVNGEIALHDLVSGDILITGQAPPPPPPPPSPPLPPPGGGLSQVAFFSPYGAIMVITADKDPSNLRTLTSGPNDNNPAWSPDGTKLAFQSDRGTGDWDIYAINWDGSGFTRLTSGPETDQDPAWSPDGTKIAFLRNGSIHVMNADGSGVTRLSFAGYDSHPSWSPDGSRIVFASSRTGVNAIHVMNADGSGVVQLTRDSANDYSPTWSPDGARIAFARKTQQANEGAYLINADGSGLTQLTLGINGHASWSPDGTRLVYELFGITVINVAGTGMTRWFSGGFNPVWSPVGTVPAAPVPYRSVEEVGGDGQVGTVGTTLPQALSVRVVHDDGTPQPGVTVRWNTWGFGAGPAAFASANVTTTDSVGVASVRLTLGTTPGQIRARAALVDGTARRAEVVFTATAVPGP